MKTLAWLVIAVCLIAVPYAIWRLVQREAVRRRESEMRSAQLLAESVRSSAKAPKTDGRD